MKILKYILALFFTLFALAQTKPIFFTFTEILNGSDNAAAFSTGKLFGHLFVMVIVLLIAVKLYKSAKNES